MAFGGAFPEKRRFAPEGKPQARLENYYSQGAVFLQAPPRAPKNFSPPFAEPENP
jgi:hypothetical protein